MEERKKRRKLEKDAALEQLRSYCAYQERCHSEVRTRLLEYQVYGQDLEDIISDLVTEGFLNELRFAQSYARGKFRMKKWGKLKIKQELKRKQVSDYCIKKGMLEIDMVEYHETLVGLLQKKNLLTREPNTYKLKRKLTEFASRKGYEYENIKLALEDVLIN